MNKYEKRFGQLRQGRTLTFKKKKLQAIEIMPRQKMRMRGFRQNMEKMEGNNDINTSGRSVRILVEKEQGNKQSSDNCCT